MGLSTQPYNFNVRQAEVERLSSRIGVSAIHHNFDEIEVECQVEVSGSCLFGLRVWDLETRRWVQSAGPAAMLHPSFQMPCLTWFRVLGLGLRI